MSRERPRRGVLPPAQENIEKLQTIVKDGNCYGAQQMYKSISTRYISAERYFEALDILQSGACLQLEYGQVTCGAELAVLFVETLVKGKIPYDEDALDRVRKIYKKFPRIPVPENFDIGIDDYMYRDGLRKLNEALRTGKIRVEGCSSFIKAAIRWSAEFGAHRSGSPELHDMLAEYIYSESPEVVGVSHLIGLEYDRRLPAALQDMTRVSYHFVRGKNPRKFASTVVNFLGKCYPREDDLTIARAILLYLSLGNLGDANNFMDEVKKQVKEKELEFTPSDLIQFSNFLLQTLQRDAFPLFNMLRQSYKSSIDREPVFDKLLDVIAEKFYGVRRRNPLQEVFGDLYKMMGSEGM